MPELEGSFAIVRIPGFPQKEGYPKFLYDLAMNVASEAVLQNESAMDQFIGGKLGEYFSHPDFGKERAISQPDYTGLGKHYTHYTKKIFHYHGEALDNEGAVHFSYNPEDGEENPITLTSIYVAGEPIVRNGEVMCAAGEMVLQHHPRTPETIKRITQAKHKLFSKIIDDQLPDELRLESFAEYIWLHANDMPDVRGSASKLTAKVFFFAQKMGIDLPMLREGVALDLEALVNDCNYFKKIFVDEIRHTYSNEHNSIFDFDQAADDNKRFQMNEIERQKYGSANWQYHFQNMVDVIQRHTFYQSEPSASGNVTHKKILSLGGYNPYLNWIEKEDIQILLGDDNQIWVRSTATNHKNDPDYQEGIQPTFDMMLTEVIKQADNDHARSLIENGAWIGSNGELFNDQQQSLGCSVGFPKDTAIAENTSWLKNYLTSKNLHSKPYRIK